MSATVLIVDDESNTRDSFAGMLKDAGYEVATAESLAEAQRQLDLGTGDILLLDALLPDGHGPTLLERLAHEEPMPPCIVITGFGDVEMAVDAMKRGAYDFLQKPVDFARLRQSVEKAAETVALRRELALLRRSAREQAEWWVGHTSTMQRIAGEAQRAAAVSAAVLLTGETGTGKEVLARAIHHMGPRKDKPFVGINCAALPGELIESELFGHEAGAFTTATKRKLGLLETADEGVLFLDEISSMPLDVQPKLLRMLDGQTFRRVGGVNEIKVDVQVLAASNQDLAAMIQQGRFREDLYYRLNVLELRLPPLRERIEDIPALVGIFIRQNIQRTGKRVAGATPRALQALKAHTWRGNLRDLRNAIERALMFCDDDEIDLQHLAPEFAAYVQTPAPNGHAIERTAKKHQSSQSPRAKRKT